MTTPTRSGTGRLVSNGRFLFFLNSITAPPDNFKRRLEGFTLNDRANLSSAKDLAGRLNPKARAVSLCAAFILARHLSARRNLTGHPSNDTGEGLTCKASKSGLSSALHDGG